MSNLPQIAWTERERAEFKRRMAALEAGGGGGGGPVAWADVTGKPTTFPPSTHGHVIADTTGLQTALDGKAAAAHTHSIANVTDLQVALDAKQPSLVSGSTIKTVGGVSLLGAGDLPVAPNFDGYTQMVPDAGLFVANSANATALGTQAQVANRTVIAPFVAAYGMTIDQLGISVSTALAASNCKAVIYAADANGRPTTILRETANISAAVAATLLSAITPLTLTAGATYWIGVRSSGTQALRTLALGALPALVYSSSATPIASPTLTLTETFANAAADWTYASGQHSNALCPLVLMRVA